MPFKSENIKIAGTKHDRRKDKMIVQKTVKAKYVTFDIRVTEDQRDIFRKYCKDNKIIMSETFSNYINSLLNGDYTPTIKQNPRNKAKFGNIGIRGRVEDKKRLTAYCSEHDLRMSDIVFGIVNDITRGELIK